MTVFVFSGVILTVCEFATSATDQCVQRRSDKIKFHAQPPLIVQKYSSLGLPRVVGEGGEGRSGN